VLAAALRERHEGLARALQRLPLLFTSPMLERRLPTRPSWRIQCSMSRRYDEQEEEPVSCRQAWCDMLEERRRHESMEEQKSEAGGRSSGI